MAQLIVPQYAATIPGWWVDDSAQTRIIGAGAAPSNFAPANLGQLKYVASQAKKHLDQKLAAVGGAGDEINALVAGFEPRAGQNYTPEQIAAFRAANYAPINLGQLKAVVAPFYRRLLAVGYDTRFNLILHGYPQTWTSGFPWNPNDPWNQAGAGDKTPNYVMANIGQLKMAFSFDVAADSDGSFLPVSLVRSTETGMSNPNGHPGRLGNGGNSPSDPIYGNASPGGGGEDLSVDPDHDPGANGVFPPSLTVETDYPNLGTAILNWWANQASAQTVEYQRKNGSGEWSTLVPTGQTGDSGQFTDSVSLLANVTSVYRLRVTYANGVVLYSNVAEAPPVPIIASQQASNSTITRRNPCIKQFTSAAVPAYYREESTNGTYGDTEMSDDNHVTQVITSTLTNVTMIIDPLGNDGLGVRNYTGGSAETIATVTDDRTGIDTSDTTGHIVPPNYLWSGSVYLHNTDLDGHVTLDQTTSYSGVNEPPFTGGGGPVTVTATTQSWTNDKGGGSNELSEPYTPEDFLGDTVELMPGYGGWEDAQIAPPAMRSVASDNSSISLTKQQYQITYYPSAPTVHTAYVVFVPTTGGLSKAQLVGSPHPASVGSGGGVCGPFEINPVDGPGDFMGGHLNGSYLVIQGLEMIANGTIEDSSTLTGKITADLDLNERTTGAGIIGQGTTGTFQLTGGMGDSSYVIHITNDSDFLVVDDRGKVVHDGDVVAASTLSGHFTVYALNTAKNGEQVSITFGMVIGDDVSLGQDTVVFTTNLSPPLSPPAGEVSGTRYRKISLNGRPLPDSKPQRTAESDQEREETYIDALTLGLRHQSTDIFVPIAGSDLVLSVRRNAISETWNNSNGLRPHERPDRPFGAGWVSTLCVDEEFVGTDTEGYVVITDQNGAQHRFIHYHQTTGETTEDGYAPFPSDSRENGDFLCSLSSDGQVFTDRYGTTITFDYTRPVAKDLTSVTYGKSSREMHTFYPAATVADRFGNTLVFSYPDASLIPATITYSGGVNQTISVEQDNAGHVTRIWDPNGNQYSFGYATKGYSSGTTQFTETVLTTVTGPDTTTIAYDYFLSTEQDLTPAALTNGAPIPKLHLDLTSITDSNQKTYSFTYDFDHTKLFHRGDTPYPQTGLPSYVTSVTLPDNLGQPVTFSFGASQIGVAFDPEAGHVTLAAGTNKVVQVTDANANVIVYTWSGSLAASLGQDTTANITFPSGTPRDPNVVFFTQMKIDYGIGSETFYFDPTAGMALSSVTDFSGNVTSYAYTDVYIPPNSINVYAGLFGSPDFALYYSDPTSQTDALGHVKTFHYADESKFRIMDSVVDEDGRLRTYTVDDLGRRSNEIIYTTDANSPVLQETDFGYSDTFKGAITKKTVKKLNGPDWSVDLVTKYVLDENGRVQSEIVDPDGLALSASYTYDRNGNRISVTDALTRTTNFEYDLRNRLKRVIYPDGSAKSVGYDNRGNKTSEQDENGHVTTYTYDALNRLISQKRTVASGDINITYAYDNAIDPVSTVTDARNHVTLFEYDTIQRLKKKTDALNHVTCFEYTGPNAGAHVFNSSGFKPTTIKDPRGYTTTNTYDNLYRAVGKSVQYQLDPPLTSDTTIGYDNVGNATTVSDSLQHTTTTEYDAVNRPVRTVYADTHDARTFYTPTGLKWKVQDELGNKTETQYDSAGRPVLTLEPPVDDGLNPEQLDRTTHIKCPGTQTFYNKVGSVIRAINPLLQERDYIYDVRNRKIEEHQPEVLDGTTGQPGLPVIYTGYDYVGNVIWVQNACGFTTETEYDEANRPVKVTAPPVLLAGGQQAVRPEKRTSYDLAGNVVTVTDANQHVTTNTYDWLNRLETTTDQEQITVRYGYDEVGNRISVKDGLLQETKFGYDGLNRNTATTDAAGYTTRLEYDGVNVVKRTDALSQVTNYGYDLRNRLLTATYPAHPVENRTYGYGAAGDLLSVTEPGKNGVADVGYTYDALHRVLTETSNGATHTYHYDLAGNRLGVQYGLAEGGNARSIVSTYDSLNRLSTMSDGGLVTAYSYDLNGNDVNQALPNGDAVTQRYDGVNRMYEKETISNRGVVYHSLSLSDAGGNVRSLKEYTAGVAPRNVTMGYDSDNRLTSEVVTDLNGSVVSNTVYDYDAANNRAHKTLNGNVATYSYNNLNQLSSWSDTSGNGASYSYDFNGNRLTRSVGGATDTYSYDSENRLVGLVKNTPGGGGTYGYDYDYRTRRVSRREGSNIAKIVFSGSTSVQEYTSTGTLSAEFVRGSDWGGGVGGILYSVRSGTASFAHYDQRGDVTARTNLGGLVTWETSYEAFGTHPVEYGTTQDRQKANTKEEDPDGLLNEGMRYRDLETGTFITRDPAGFVDGPNLYAYVRQNPWTHFDPQGLDEDDDDESGGYDYTAMANMVGDLAKSAMDTVANYMDRGLNLAEFGDASQAFADHRRAESQARWDSLMQANARLIQATDQFFDSHPALKKAGDFLTQNASLLMVDGVPIPEGAVLGAVTTEKAVLPTLTAEMTAAKTAQQIELPVAETSGQSQLLDTLNLRARQLELGTDPARGYIEAEGIAGVRIEQALGRTISRGPDEAIDFVDSQLGNISLKGPIPAKGSVDGLANAAIKDANFNTATRTLIIDTKGLSEAQISALKSAVEANVGRSSKTIIYLH
ncbi:RHS repeat-associated core domain-containing protein [Chthoniobacter flavus]|nr:RHS repeat-associated core domain-containing protein [Chthoniobacter flavus]